VIAAESASRTAYNGAPHGEVTTTATSRRRVSQNGDAVCFRRRNWRFRPDRTEQHAAVAARSADWCGDVPEIQVQSEDLREKRTLGRIIELDWEGPSQDPRGPQVCSRIATRIGVEIERRKHIESGLHVMAPML